MLQLDSKGNYWSLSPENPLGKMWDRRTYGHPIPGFIGLGDVPNSGSDWTDFVRGIVTQYVLPVLTVAVAAFVPGLGGIAAVAILSAATQLARGAPVDTALINATRDALPSLLESEQFNKALALGKENVPPSAIAAAKAALGSEQAQKAFDTGLIFAKAEKLQLSALEAFKKAHPSDASAIQYAFNNKASLIDIAEKFGGTAGVSQVNQITASESSSTSGGGSSGGSGLGTLAALALLGGGGYLAAKYGRHLLERKGR